MFQQSITFITDPVPPAFFEDTRPTVGMILVSSSSRGNGIVLVEHERAQWGVLLPPQGGIAKDESFVAAFCRELSEELPDAEIDPKSIRFLGDVRNDKVPAEREGGTAGGKKPNHFFWGVAQLINHPQKFNPEELRGPPQYVHSAGELGACLSVPGIRAKKRGMVLEAVGRTFDMRWLHSGFAGCSFKDLAAA